MKKCVKSIIISGIILIVLTLGILINVNVCSAEASIKSCFLVCDVEKQLLEMSEEIENDCKVYQIEMEDINIEENTIKVNYIELINTLDVDRLIETGIYYNGYEAWGQYEYYDEVNENITYNVDKECFIYVLNDELNQFMAINLEELLIQYEKNINKCFQVAVKDNNIMGILEQYME